MGKVRKFCDIFNNPPMLNMKFGAGAVGAGAASRYGSGSDKKVAAPCGSDTATLVRSIVSSNKNIFLLTYM
jgi:hypothetical protein